MRYSSDRGRSNGGIEQSNPDPKHNHAEHKDPHVRESSTSNDKNTEHQTVAINDPSDGGDV